MGHEAIVYGFIVGARGPVGDGFRRMQERNRAILNHYPFDDSWPFLVRGMFALPAQWPYGTYRNQIIHFGASIKDDPSDPETWDIWLAKFERLLMRLFWWSAQVHIQTDFGDRLVRWEPTERARTTLYSAAPQPIDEWIRTEQD